jgi:hypothetical protein
MMCDRHLADSCDRNAFGSQEIDQQSISLAQIALIARIDRPQGT